MNGMLTNVDLNLQDRTLTYTGMPLEYITDIRDEDLLLGESTWSSQFYILFTEYCKLAAKYPEGGLFQSIPGNDYNIFGVMSNISDLDVLDWAKKLGLALYPESFLAVKQAVIYNGGGFKVIVKLIANDY